MDINIVASQHTITNPTIVDTINISEIDKLNINTYDTIFIGDSANFLELNELIPLLSKIKTKLLQGGKLIVEAFDQFEVCLGISQDRLNSVDFNNIVRPRSSLFNINDIKDVLRRVNFKILKIDIDNLKYYIEAINE